MTVRRSGDCPGDCEGESILPAVDDTSTSSGSTELIPQGRFWVLAAEDQGSSSEVEEETGGSESAFRYLCRSPSPDDGRDLIESASGLARRAERCLERQRRQRLAAREFSSPSCKVRSPASSSSPPARKTSPILRSRLPVLDPTSFPIAADDVAGWTVVRRRHRSSESSKETFSSDPVNPRFKKNELLGSFAKLNMHRACIPGRPSMLNAVHREARRTKAQSVRSLPQKIPIDADIAAGRAWRHKLGFWWARANSSARGGGDRAGGGVCAVDEMSNSGGGGGFSPARGNGPGRGRGDRGGGHNGPGHGGGYNGPASSAGFNGPSAFNTGRGGGYNNRFFGGDNGRPRNFVAGESNGTADDRDNGQGQPFPADFGSEFGHFNRGSNFNNYHRNGGNQQYRPRNYGNNNFNSNNRNGYNGGRSNFNQYRNSGGGSFDLVIQNGASLAGINPDLLKEAMQGVVTALAATAQRGGAEGIPTSALAAAAPTAGQSVAPVVQQSQTLVPGPQQAQPMQLDSTTLPKPDAPNPAKKAKKADKNPCFRCKQPGHQFDTCTAPVCDLCEPPNHISSACPLLQAPKPPVTMYGYAIEQLMFFELPTGGTYKPKVDNVKLVKVTIEGGPMSISEIAECLRRIVPVENFQWEIYNFQNNVFRVKFPNKSEAQRMKTFRTYPVPDRASDLIFEDCDGMDNNVDNNGGGDTNGSNGDNRDGSNDMDIEKAMNNEQQGNGNSQKGNVKNVNNGKGVVGHQVQHQFEAPILVGSLNTDLLSKEMEKEGTPFKADPAPGSVMI
ncbi:hypothetical protein ACQ4PT_060844 [Festuca glaucescens]